MLRSISGQGPKVTKEDITRLECKLGHKIPSDYAQFILDYNGGIPKQSCHNVQNTQGTNIGSFINIEWFYSIARLDDESNETSEVYTVGWNYSTYYKRMPANFLPIGADGGGNQICISFYGEDKGSIWYWDHHGEIIPPDWNYELESHKPDYSNCYKVANSFQELLDGLFEYDFENDTRIP